MLILVHFGGCPAGQLSFLGLWPKALKEDVRLLQPHLGKERGVLTSSRYRWESKHTSCRRSLVLAKKVGGPQMYAWWKRHSQRNFASRGTWQPLGRRGPITSAVQGVEEGSRVTLKALARPAIAIRWMVDDKIWGICNFVDLL